MTDSVTMIVRACGERTTARSAELLRETFGDVPVHIVEEVPHPRALRECFRLGIAEGRPWVLIIDADVLTLDNGIRALLDETVRLPRCVLNLQGLIFDKFFATTRPAGNHVYRTSLLARAMEFIPAEGTSLRPETDTLHAMERQGYPWLKRQIVVGTHDFGPYFRDIYRKAFLHAHKHAHQADYFGSLWQSLGRSDPDFRVAHHALLAGRRFAGPVQVSKDFRPDDAVRALSELGLEEKTETDSRLDPRELIESLQAMMSVEQLAATREMGYQFSQERTWKRRRAWRRRWRYRLRRTFSGRSRVPASPGETGQ